METQGVLVDASLNQNANDPKRPGAAGFSGLSFDSARAHRTQRVNLSKVFCPCGLNFQRHVQTLGSAVSKGPTLSAQENKGWTAEICITGVDFSEKLNKN